VQSHRPFSSGVLRFLVRYSFQSQLDRVAIAVPVRSFGAGTGGLATPEPNIFDAVPHQPVQDHGILPVDERADPFFPPARARPACIRVEAGARSECPACWSCPPACPTHVPCSRRRTLLAWPTHTRLAA